MATLRRNTVISILFIVLGGPGIVLVYLPLWFTHFDVPAGEPLWQTLLAAGLIAAGLTPLLESIRRFIVVGRGTLVPVVPTERLVVSGLYRYVRNPMYVGVVMAASGEAVLFRSSDLAIYTVVVALGFHLFVCLYEEPTLTRRYPEDYPRYKNHVPRWWPLRTPWEEPENQGRNLSGPASVQPK